MKKKKKNNDDLQEVLDRILCPNAQLKELVADMSPGSVRLLAGFLARWTHELLRYAHELERKTDGEGALLFEAAVQFVRAGKTN